MEQKCSKAEIRVQVCWALCRHDGADTGSYELKTDSCICGFRKKYEEMTEQTLTLGPHFPEPAAPPEPLVKFHYGGYSE